MQVLSSRVVDALNNLPGFPPRPSTPSATPQAGQFLLGEWLKEVRVRPGVAALVNLPAVDNTIGDVRFVVSLGAWYWWDGAVWQPVAGGGGGGVATVTASAPLSSSGGANPDVSFPSWPANASGALTNDGLGNLSWSAAAGSSVNVTSTATVALAAGESVRFVSGGVQKADANAPAQLEPVGFVVAAAGAGAPVTVRTGGLADVPAALFDVAPLAGNVGKRVWLSTTAGRVTLTAPSNPGDVVQRVGILATLAGGGGGSPQILVQVGDPVLL